MAASFVDFRKRVVRADYKGIVSAAVTARLK